MHIRRTFTWKWPKACFLQCTSLNEFSTMMVEILLSWGKITYLVRNRDSSTRGGHQEPAPPYFIHFIYVFFLSYHRLVSLSLCNTLPLTSNLITPLVLRLHWTNSTFSSWQRRVIIYMPTTGHCQGNLKLRPKNLNKVSPSQDRY